MATTIINREVEQVSEGNDSIVVTRDIADVPGGRSLDCTGFTGIIKAGHVIKITTATGVCAPLGLSGTSYVSLEAGEAYLGILKASVSVGDARAAILTMGQVNAAACPYEITSTIKSGLPQINFIN